MKSKIYRGFVTHKRIRPVEHFFIYSLFMMYIDLDEIEEVTSLSPLISKEKLNLVTFKRDDYHRPAIPSLKEAIYKTVWEKAGIRLNGPVRMLTHLRYFGYCMNPVTFYYCFDENDSKVKAIVAEIENTPWGERFQYVLQTNDSQEYQFEKTFHVSPFFPMDMQYQWKFNEPSEDLLVNMDNLKNDKKDFNAHLRMRAMELNSKSLHRVLLSFPFMTLKVILGIYYQALKLWIKKVPFYPHPNKNSQRTFLISKGDKHE